MKWNPGKLLMITGIGHALVGVVLYYDALAAILRDGLFNAVAPHFDRQAAFWFLLFSPLCFLLGQVVDRAIARRDADLLTLLGWHILAFGAVGVILMPVSGFWILIAIAPLIFKSARGLGLPSASVSASSLRPLAS